MSEVYKIDQKEELIGGRMVAMSPTASNHNRISRNILGIFWNYLQGKTCEPFGDGELVYLTEEDEFIPDFMVVCDPDKIKFDGIHGAPDLVVEILSPSTAKVDRTHKKDVYAKSGVREYWTVSPNDKIIDVFRSNGQGEFVFHDTYTFFADWELKRMTEEERQAVVTHFNCCLYDDFDIYLDDIFYKVP
jgi:Uma2 family endonuclease